ncbi:uncharacterized protein LOC123524753 [Mercenaria mercenaria]|uniref:uncharacterized protein LOC123524753 n=1 Tax=Mercenaria mercenaria TaxID=6596 RepID=UPI00234E504E|nr:uncharacterized protein LOC123524753 [Mercenaria mercenaria]XP_053394478.1 uncharacterized protein LOC123524753 [Mercenaria mercenaria]
MAWYDIRFGLSLTLSATLFIGTLIINGVSVSILRSHEELKPWFLPYLGFLLFPVIILHIVSAVLFLAEKGDKVSTKSTVGLAVLHLLQLGFLWRHVVVFREVDLNLHAQGKNYLKYLQLVFTFIFLLPLLLIQTFIIIYFNFTDWIFIVTLLLTFFGTCWFLASFRITKRQDEYEVQEFSFIGVICRLLWRTGEVTFRVTCLALFATLYFYWIFLILGLHGLIMFICLSTNFGLFNKQSALKSNKVLVNGMLTYIYLFCFINFDTEQATFRHSFYYLVMFLENIVLTVVWYIHVDDNTVMFNKNIFVLISASAFVVGVISLILYRICFTSVPLFDSEKEHIYESEGCINCRLSLCSKHSIKMQRPFSAGYFSQYQNAVSNGQYYKNILQDTFLDSGSESAAEILNSSGEHWQIRDTDLESIPTAEKKQYTAVQASGTYTHKRFFDSDSSIAKMTDTDSISSGSGVYEKDWRQNSDTILSQLSTMDALSLVSSRTRLLTDSWDNLIQKNSEVAEDNKHPVKIDILNSLIRKDHDTSFFSDGYMTDHTLDSYQLPVTVLAKKRMADRKKIEPAYSTASDSTDCTICAFMRQHQSSPEESRRNFSIRDGIPEETEYKTTRKKRREYSASKSASRHKSYVPKPKGNRDKNGVYSHKYEKAYSRQRRRDMIGVTDSTSKTDSRHINTSATNQSKMSLKADYSSSVADTSIDESSVHSIRRSSDVCSFVQTKGSNSVTFSDSEDSAYPRNTPVSDWSGSTHKCVRDKTVYAKPVKHIYNDKTEKYSSVRHTPTKDPSNVGLSLKPPLRTYLAATDNDKDGTSESSCEMII